MRVRRPAKYSNFLLAPRIIEDESKEVTIAPAGIRVVRIVSQKAIDMKG